MADEAARGGQQPADLRDGEVVFFHIIQQVGHGNAAAAGRSHGALAAHDVVAVHHPAPAVGGYGDAAADVADHEVAFLVLPAQHVLAVADGGLLQVQGVQVHNAVHAPDARHAGHILGLIHVRGIDDHSPDAAA